MRAMHLRKTATVLLDSAIRIAPPDSREWGRAMRTELDYVENPWGALMWAFGSAGVLARRALAAMLTPGGRGLSEAGGLLAREIPIRKAALAASGACLVAALVFFTAPPFRQALRVSFSPWIGILQAYPTNYQPRLEALATRAERHRDAEGLAFCALRVSNSRESAPLAQEAVSLRPSLVWIYALVAMRHRRLPEISGWLPQLERFDPQNALLPLIAAEHVEAERASGEGGRAQSRESGRMWQRAMAAAFHAPRFDDYSGRARELARRVVMRYRFYDPYVVLSQTLFDPTGDCRRFASVLVHVGDAFEARGNERRAMHAYLEVARFGQLIDGNTEPERKVGASLQALAYRHIQALSLKEGRLSEAALFGYLSSKYANSGRAERGERIFGREVSSRNAAFLQISGVMVLVFAGLLAAAALFLILGRRARPQRFRSAATVVALISAVGALLSAATLYLTYRPYWYIFQSAVVNGDRSHLGDLRDFLIASQAPLGPLGRVRLELPVYFWAGVIFLCVLALAVIVLRHLRPSASGDRFQHNPHTP